MEYTLINDEILGELVEVSLNGEIQNRYTKTEVERLIQETQAQIDFLEAEKSGREQMLSLFTV
jgi:hypothetical protein